MSTFWIATELKNAVALGVLVLMLLWRPQGPAGNKREDRLMDWGEIFIDASVAAIGPVAAAYALAAIGLNVQFGYTGLLNFGHVAFMLMGAYGLAVTVDAGGSFWLGLVVGVLAAIALGLVLGAPTLRLRADYLAIVTISAAEILRLVVRSSWAEPVTNGVFGIQRFAEPFFDLNPFSSNRRYGVGRLRVPRPPAMGHGCRLDTCPLATASCGDSSRVHGDGPFERFVKTKMPCAQWARTSSS